MAGDQAQGLGARQVLPFRRSPGTRSLFLPWLIHLPFLFYRVSHRGGSSLTEGAWLLVFPLKHFKIMLHQLRLIINVEPLYTWLVVSCFT